MKYRMLLFGSLIGAVSLSAVAGCSSDTPQAPDEGPATDQLIVSASSQAPPVSVAPAAQPAAVPIGDPASMQIGLYSFTSARMRIAQVLFLRRLTMVGHRSLRISPRILSCLGPEMSQSERIPASLCVSRIFLSSSRLFQVEHA